MADQQNTIRTTVELDASQAEQEIVKLNARASDSTKTLTERVEAKNKAVELQDQLSKKTISDLEAQIKLEEKNGATGAKLLKSKNKLNKARLKATKLSENNVKAQGKLQASLKSSQSATENLDRASGGLLSKFKLLATNPIGLALIAIVGAVTALTAALASSEEGQNKMAKAGAILSSVLGNVMDVISDLANMLFDAFAEPQKTIDNLGKKIKENIQNRLDGLLELIPKLGKALTQLFEGDFVEAAITAGDAVGKIVTGVDKLSDSIKDAGKALSDFADEVAEDAKKAAAIADKRARADKAERNLIIEKAKAEREIAKFREIAARKDSVSAAERLEAIKSASAVSQRINEREIAVARLRADALIAENKLSNSNKAALDAEAQAKAKIINLETARLTLQKSLSAELATVAKEQEGLDAKAAAARQKEIDDAEKIRLKAEEQKKADKEKADQERQLAKEKAEEDRIIEEEAQIRLDELEIERLEAQGEKVLDLELALLERKRKQDTSFAELTATEIQAINEEAELAKDALRKKSQDAEKKKEQIVLQNAINGAAEAFGIAQEVAVAKMIMAAPEAIGNSFKMASASYVPPLSIVMGALGAAGTIVPIIKGLSDIKNTRFSKKRGGTPSGSISSSTSSSGAQGITPQIVSDIAANNASRLGSDVGISNTASSVASSNLVGSASSNIVFSESKYSDFQDQVAFKEEKTTI